MNPKYYIIGFLDHLLLDPSKEIMQEKIEFITNAHSPHLMVHWNLPDPLMLEEKIKGYQAIPIPGRQWPEDFPDLPQILSEAIMKELRSYKNDHERTTALTEILSSYLKEYLLYLDWEE